MPVLGRTRGARRRNAPRFEHLRPTCRHSGKILEFLIFEKFSKIEKFQKFRTKNFSKIENSPKNYFQIITVKFQYNSRTTNKVTREQLFNAIDAYKGKDADVKVAVKEIQQILG